MTPENRSRSFRVIRPFRTGKVENKEAGFRLSGRDIENRYLAHCAFGSVHVESTGRSGGSSLRPFEQFERFERVEQDRATKVGG